MDLLIGASLVERYYALGKSNIIPIMLETTNMLQQLRVGSEYLFVGVSRGCGFHASRGL